MKVFCAILLISASLARAELPDIRVSAAVPMAPPALPEKGPGGYLWWYARVAQATRPSGCVHRPSCSRYGAEAVRQHGPLLGTLLAADRLYREPDDQRRAPRVRVQERLFVPDPVSHNTFWWKSSDEIHSTHYYTHLLASRWTGRLR